MFETLAEYDRIIASLHGNISALKIYPEVYTAEEHKYLHPIYDRALFGALSLLDLVVGLKYLDASKGVENQFEINYFARIVAHCIYETIRHQDKFAGKEVLKVVEDRLGAEASGELKSITRKLNEVRKKHFNYLKSIRNELFGHKLASGIEQATKILEVDDQKIYEIGTDVTSCQIEILTSYVRLMERI